MYAPESQNLTEPRAHENACKQKSGETVAEWDALQNSLRDQKIAALSKLRKAGATDQAGQLFEELKESHPAHLPLYTAWLKVCRRRRGCYLALSVVHRPGQRVYGCTQLRVYTKKDRLLSHVQTLDSAQEDRTVALEAGDCRPEADLAEIVKAADAVLALVCASFVSGSTLRCLLSR